MYPPVIFKDREEAGEKLGQLLRKLKLKEPVVLAIPSGGVPVAKEIARILECPFDLVIVRKIQYPWTTEAGFGAVAANGTIYYSPYSESLSQEVVNLQTQKAIEEVKHREKVFLKRRKRIQLEDKIAVLVDDGLAAGSTIFTAVKAVKKHNPKKIIVAVPTASQSAIELIKPLVNKLISLYVHPKNLPFAVASSYQNWHDLTNQEVKEYFGVDKS